MWMRYHDGFEAAFRVDLGAFSSSIYMGGSERADELQSPFVEKGDEIPEDIPRFRLQ